MKHQRDGAGPSTNDFRLSRYDGAVRAKLGETLRERHDLKEPFAPRLLELLAQLGTTVHVREAEEAKLYAEVDDCIAAMVCVAARTRGSLATVNPARRGRRRTFHQI
jgi:hypothetical protein